MHCKRSDRTIAVEHQRRVRALSIVDAVEVGNSQPEALRHQAQRLWAGEPTLLTL